MADNIGTAGTVTLTNMKPASGESIASLWGQNMADFAGWLYYHLKHHQNILGRLGATYALFDASKRHVKGGAENFYFVKSDAYNTYTGTVNYYLSAHSNDGDAKGTVSFSIDGTEILKKSLQVGTNHGTNNGGTAITWDASHLTNGNQYKASIEYSGYSVPNGVGESVLY